MAANAYVTGHEGLVPHAVVTMRVIPQDPCESGNPLALCAADSAYAVSAASPVSRVLASDTTRARVFTAPAIAFRLSTIKPAWSMSI